MKYFYIFLVVVAVVSFITGLVISIIDKSVKKEMERIYRKDFENEDEIVETRDYAFTLIGDVLDNVKKETISTQVVDYYEEPVMIQSISIDEYNKTREGNV